MEKDRRLDHLSGEGFTKDVAKALAVDNIGQGVSCRTRRLINLSAESETLVSGINIVLSVATSPELTAV
jgi:hypothetical protein